MPGPNARSAWLRLAVEPCLRQGVAAGMTVAAISRWAPAMSMFGASLEVGRPRLLRPEVGDLAEPVLAQQLVYLAGQEPAHERLAHLGAAAIRAVVPQSAAGGWL